MSSATPGIIIEETCSDGEEKSFLFAEERMFPLFDTDRPVPILAAGLSAARRDYLRDNVRCILSARGREGFPC
ncbi:hypothetical protein DPMN_021655 [Dreissena polymorpha]|uniref:Uncharacterized protein n=1 Tax=Dreissena polymorpha TaxID=45954 RepID=A0A9D4SBY1_DREPO|nr:hypothetical protein DPMN_021655 [Dreissena polymorpha]